LRAEKEIALLTERESAEVAYVMPGSALTITVKVVTFVI